MSSAPSQQGEKALMTVRVDREVLEQVKEYARKTDTSVSSLVRQFFRHLLAEAKKSTDEVEQL